MSGLKDRIKALETLGYFFSNISEVDSRYDTFFEAIDRAQIQNGWFQKKACLTAIQSWGSALQPDKIARGNAPISDSLIRAKYLPPYQKAIDAGVGTVMASFNSINDLKYFNLEGSSLYLRLLYALKRSTTDVLKLSFGLNRSANA